MIEVKFYEEVKDENEETFGFLYLAEVKEFEKENGGIKIDESVIYSK